MWKYYNPVEVVFGTGKLDELGQLMAERGLDRALIVSDPFTHRSGVAARLKECAGGRVLDIISEVEPNPTCDNVDACARRARELGARSIIGLGGGSAMDCAKAAAAAAAMDCTGLELLRGRPVTDALPLIAVPTTAGTGSEVGWGAVLSDHAANAKIAIFGSPMFPRLALVDPVLTYTVPPAVTASTGLDVIAHSLDSMCSVRANPVSDGLAVRAAKEKAEDPEAFTDNIIMYEVLSELKDIAARGGIRCRCGSTRYGIQVHRDSVDLCCQDCGGKLRRPAATDEDLDRLCCQMTLTIPGRA